MARTRGRCKKEVRESLPLDSDLLVHVFTALSLNHGTDCLEIASAVCRRWHERVAGGRALDEDPENCIGELRSGDKPHRFDRPHDALFLPNGDICVADCDNFRLQIVSREGYYMREVPLGGGTSCPTGLATWGESLFVVEHGAHQVSKLRKSSSSGHRHATAGSWGNGDGQLRHPWGAAVASKRVYVTDQGNNRISVFDTDKLKWLFSFGSDGAKQGQFREPRGLAVHGTELFVADYRNHRIQVFSTADADKAKCPVVRILGGGPSSTVGRFNGPSGVFIHNEKLFVTEIRGERLQVLTLAGLPLQVLSGFGPLSGVTVDDDHACCTSLEGDHAIVLWRVLPPPQSILLMSGRAMSEHGSEAGSSAGSPTETAAMPRRQSPKIPPTRPS